MKKRLGWGSVFAVLLLCALVALVSVLSQIGRASCRERG